MFYRSLFPRDLVSELDRLQREMQQAYEFSPSIRGLARGGFPAMNVGNTPHSVEIYAFLPGIDPAAEPASTTDSEIVFTPADNPGKAATFRHATHTQLLSCKNCHPALFKKRDENLQFTHDDMEEGKKYCGACHFTVVVVPSGCKGCHAGKKSPAPATAAPAVAS